MSRGEEKTKRWRASIFDLIALCGGISIAFALIRLAARGEFAEGIRELLGVFGLFYLVGSIGAFGGKVYWGTASGAVRGFLYACLAVLIFGGILSMNIPSVP